MVATCAGFFLPCNKSMFYMKNLKEKFNQEANALAEGLVEGGVSVASEGSVAEKKKPESKQKGRKPKQGGENDKFNQQSWLIDKLKGQFYMCSISQRLYFAEDNTELDERRAKTFLLNLQRVAPITSEVFWNYLGSDNIPERNVIREYFEQLPGCRDVIGDYFGALKLAEGSNEKLLYSIFRKWLIGAVAQVCKLQFFPNTLIPVLVSPLFLGKTAFFMKLAFDNAREAKSEIGRYCSTQRLKGGFDKDTQTIFASMFLAILDDLDKSDFKDSSSVRTLVSAIELYFRAPFAKLFRLVPKICSLCGTTNEKDFISRAKHNRRIVPIEIESIDFEALNKVKASEIWCSAYTAYMKGETWDLTKEEVDYIVALSGGFTQTTGLEEYMAQFIQPCKKGDKDALFSRSPILYAEYIQQNPTMEKHYSQDKFQTYLRQNFEYGAKKIDKQVVRGYWYIKLADFG
jgi:hypothetical protein